MTWIAVAEPAAVEAIMMMATCSLTEPCVSGLIHIKNLFNSLLKGPGLMNLKRPLVGRPACIALPNQYDKTSRKSVETNSVCGLK